MSGLHVCAMQAEQPWWWTDVTWSFIGVVLVVIGALLAWYLNARKRSKVANLLDMIDTIHAQSHGTSHSSERELSNFKDVIASELKRGKIDESSYLILDKRIDDYVRQAREKIIEERFTNIPHSIKSELKIMIDDGKVTEGEVYAFEKVLSSSSVSERDKGELRNLLTEWQARKGGIPTGKQRYESPSAEPQILSRIKKSLSLGPVVVGRKKKQ